MFGALGLYPEVPGVGVLAIGSPLFARTEIRLPHRRRALILASASEVTTSGAGKKRQRQVHALSPAAAPYIQSLRLDGRAYAKPWTTYCALARGATLSFHLGRRPRRSWGAAAAAAPPSFGPQRPMPRGRLRPVSQRSTALWILAGLTALGVAVRFASLGVQSYHHDEVITALRVLPGSFGEMLHAVKVSESNPPLYYVLGWAWAKEFGTGEVGLRSLSALFGAATVPVGYLIGRQLATRRAGLILAALIAVNPMLVWYSQEARSYALLVFFGALATVLLRASAGHGPGARPRRLGAGLGAGALQPLLRRLRGRDRGALAAGGAAVALAGRAAGARGGRRGGPGAAAAGQLADQPDPHRLDRKQPPGRTLLGDRGLLPGRRNRARDRRGAARPLRAGAV